MLFIELCQKHLCLFVDHMLLGYPATGRYCFWISSRWHQPFPSVFLCFITYCILIEHSPPVSDKSPALPLAPSVCAQCAAHVPAVILHIVRVICPRGSAITTCTALENLTLICYLLQSHYLERHLWMFYISSMKCKTSCYKILFPLALNKTFYF